MKHLVMITRDEGDLDIVQVVSDFTAAQAKMDEFIQKAHDGHYGIGHFSGWIYERGVEGHIERCVVVIHSFKIPRLEETA